MKVGPNLALRTAINALRDIVESERMPNGIPLKGQFKKSPGGLFTFLRNG
jgi:hypothetical protein